MRKIHPAREEQVNLRRTTAEDVVLFAARTLAASQAADQKHCDTRGNQHGQQVLVRHEPMNQSMHDGDTYPLTPKLLDPHTKLDAMHSNSVLRSTGIPAR